MYTFTKKVQYGRFEQTITVNVDVKARITYSGLTKTISNDELAYELGKIETDISNKLCEKYNTEQETIRILTNIGYKES